MVCRFWLFLLEDISLLLYFRRVCVWLLVQSCSSTSFIPHTNSQTERMNHVLEGMLRDSVLYFKGGWNDRPVEDVTFNNSYHSSLGMVPFEASYGRPCRIPTCWTRVGYGSLINNNSLCGPNLVKQTTEKIVVIMDNMRAIQSQYKTFVDKRRGKLEFGWWFCICENFIA